MPRSVYLSLVANIALLLAMGLIYELLMRRWRRGPAPLRQGPAGIVLGLIGIAIMLTPWEYTPGIVFDTRSVLLGTCGLFFGALPTAVAMIMTAAFRLYEGGMAAWAGTGVILSSGGIGLAWRHWRRGALADISWGELYIFGVVIHIAMLLWMLLLPWETAQKVLATITVPVLTIYPVGTALLGALMADFLGSERTEKSLQESEARYRLLFNTVNDAIYVYPLEEDGRPGNFIEVNDLAWQRLGYTREELLSQSILDLNPKLNPDRILDLMRQLRGEGRLLLETWHRRRDDKVIPVEVNCQFFELNGRPSVVTIARDLSDRQEAAQALQRQRDQAQQYLDIAAVMMLALDRQGRITLINHKGCQVLGYQEEELLGRNWFESFLPEAGRRAAQEVFAGLLAGRGATLDYAENTVLTKSGKERLIAWHNTILHDDQGAITGTLSSGEDITERRRSEAALQESQRRLSLAQEIAHIGNWEWDVATGKTTWSDEVYRIFGLTPQEIEPSYELARHHVHPDDVEFWAAAVQEALASQDRFRLDYRGLRADGRLVWIYNEGFVERDAAGIATGIKGTAQDITARKQAEAALSQHNLELREIARQLEQSRNTLQLIIESVPIRVFWKDKNLRYLGCNTLFARDAGFDRPEELLGQDDYSMGWREQADLYRASDRRVMESRQPKMNLIEPQTTPTGGRIWLNTSKVPLQMPNGEILGVLGVYEDITARKAAEETLRITRESLELALQGADLGSWDWDLQTDAVTFNARWAEMLGYRLDEIEPHLRSWEKLVHPEDLPAALQIFQGHVEGKASFYESEYRMRHKSGAWVWILDRGKVIARDPQGVPLRACGIHQDITGRKRAEAERLYVNKLESLATLAGGIAHDFNNILTAILGNISLAKIDPDDGQSLTDAETACLRAKALAQQLLTFAKGGSPVKKLLSVAELVEDTASFVCRGAKGRCTCHLPQDLWAVYADPGQLGQVFQNVLLNALQAMPEGGEISARGENLEVTADDNLPLLPGRYIRISIQDEGLGIPAQHLPRIFDPYFTTKQAGSGLGLATTYAIVKAHHGHLAVESTLGEGTVFHVYLPATEEKVTDLPLKGDDIISGQGRILVMDDEELVRGIVGKMLGHLGYEATFAVEGGEAVELFRRAQEQGTPFDGVILDLTVPGGMGGKTALEKILAIDPQMKVIVSSGYSEDAVMADFSKYGFAGVIGKPYRLEELSRVLHQVLQAGPGQASPS